MKNIYVQFSDSTETIIIATFSSPQSVSNYPFQGVIGASDNRYAIFYNSMPLEIQGSMIEVPTVKT